MARRRSSGGDTISLFPFLSILAGVIGTLTLMITAVALSQVSKPKAEDPVAAAAAAARLEQFKELQELIKLDTAELERLRKLIAEAEALRNKLVADREKLQQAKLEQLEAQKQHSEIITLITEAEKIAKRITDLEQSISDAQEELQQLTAELNKRKEPPKEATVKILPGGSGFGLKPTFVECTSQGVVLHYGDEPQRVAAKDLDTNQAYLQLLDRVGADKNGTIVFLVRSDGTGTYRTAAKLAKDKDVRNGKLPVPGNGNLDLSAYKGKR